MKKTLLQELYQPLSEKITDKERHEIYHLDYVNKKKIHKKKKSKSSK
jgi:hypothetical protein